MQWRDAIFNFTRMYDLSNLHTKKTNGVLFQDMRESKAVKVVKQHNEILRKHLNKVDLTIQLKERERTFLERLLNG